MDAQVIAVHLPYRPFICVKGGKLFKESAKASALIMFGPVLGGVFMGLLMMNASIYPKQFAYTSWLFYGIGFVLFFVAKISVIKKKKIFTFGPSSMTKKNRILYKSGYALMGIAFILTIALLMASSFKILLF